MGKRKPVYRKQTKKILIKCARQIKLQRLPDLSNGTIRRPQDQDRISYMEGYLRAVLAAVRDGGDVRAYTYWSLIDNFEWLNGYTERFGLFEVDYNSPNKTRTPRDSAHYYKQIISTGRLPPRPKYYNYTV